MRFVPLLILLLLSINVLVARDLTGEVAPEFSGMSIDGKEIRLADYRGKVVLLDFWASWCVPCREELPFLVEFYRENQNKNFIVLAVNIDDREENMRSFLAKNYATHVFPVIFDKEKSIPPLYDLQAMPTSIFIDKKGVIRYVHTGFTEEIKNDIKKELLTLLSEK